MRTLLLAAALVMTTEAAAQVRIQTAPNAYAYFVGDPDRPMIGVSTRSTGMRDTLGLLVESVTRDGPAEKAGIEEGDRLVSVNGVNLKLSAADAGEPDMEGVPNRRLIRELEKRKAGDEVELRVWRDGNLRSVRVKTVSADELNQGTFRASAFSRGFNSDRAALGLSLGGNGSRRDTLGILIVGVSDSGPAARAGIDEGDRVAAINGVDLRVASEDAGDWQASSARINRLNREMEKVKAGDAVELRVVSGGQVRTVRVESMKASDIEGEGFFFSNGGRGRTMVIPRAGTIRYRPPVAGFDAMEWKADLEQSVEAMKAEIQARVQPEVKLKSQLRMVPAKSKLLRTSSIL